MELGARFRLERQIGHGGSSVVYRAVEIGNGRAVAVKILDTAHAHEPTSIARFRDEVNKAREIHHPHAVAILDFDQLDDGTLYMVMELVNGVNLSELLRDEGPLPEARTTHILKQVADCVGAAHRLGLVHRDLKPENIMIEPHRNGLSDWASVLDFGIAKAFGARGDGVTRTGTLIGTPFYMSPEQCQGKPLDARSDIYALGVVMYEMLTGHRPFETRSDSLIPLLMKHIEERPRPMRVVKPDLDVSRDLERLVMGALSKDPNWRPANGTELYVALDRVERIRAGKNFDRVPRTADEVRRAARARDRRSGKGRRRSVAALQELARLPAASGGVLATAAAACALALAVWIGFRSSKPTAGPLVDDASSGAPIVRAFGAPGRVPSPPSQPPPGPRPDVSELLTQGRRELDARRYADAAERFELARDVEPRNPEAWFGLGRATLGLGRPHDAAAYLRKVVDLANSDPRAEPLATQADRLVTEIDKVDGMLREARSLRGSGRISEAIERYRGYLAKRPDDVDAQQSLAKLLVETGRNSEAEVVLREVLRLTPSEAEPHHALGSVLLALNRRDEAIEELKLALDLDPTREDTKRYLSLARAGRGGK